MSRQGTPQRPNGGAPQGKIQPFKLVLLGELVCLFVFYFCFFFVCFLLVNSKKLIFLVLSIGKKKECSSLMINQ